MGEINENDAPKGFKAGLAAGGIQRCTGCHFCTRVFTCPDHACEADERTDNRDVIFIKKEK